ncbi:MAG: hypothetical protein AAF913_16235 [Pseudomonadota bacterium]
MSAPHRIDEAAFGVVYGTITVMGLLLAMDPDHIEPLRAAGYLFVSVLAVAMAKAFAELCETALKTGQNARPADIASAWRHSRTTLIAANGPTGAFLLAATGLIDGATAHALAQLLAIALLCAFGVRIGRALDGTVRASVIGAAVCGGIGLAIALLKNAIH